MDPSLNQDTFPVGMDVREENFRDSLNRIAESAAKFNSIYSELMRVIATTEIEQEGAAGETIAIKITDVQSGLKGENKWQYKASEVEKTVAGYEGWSHKPGGGVGLAFNLSEDFNTGDGEEGNGINASDLKTNFHEAFKFKPYPKGRVFWAKLVAIPGKSLRETPGSNESSLEAWFDGNNAVDGSCPEGTEAA